MYNIVGFRPVNFKDQRSGAQIVGTTFYVTCENDGVVGLECKKFFVKSTIDTSFVRVGSMVNIAFNENGKVVSVTEAE